MKQAAKRPRSNRFAGLFLTVVLCLPPRAFAVVGQAERLDPVQQDELDEFHQNLVADENAAGSYARTEELTQMLDEKQAKLPTASEKDQSEMKREIEQLRRDLLTIPKRDRVRFEFDGQYKYDSNINRSTHEDENGDSVFDEVSVVYFDLSGRKTDLRFEVQGDKQWNIHFPEKDFYGVEERLRYRRRYFKKLANSAQSRLARHNEKTVEINGEKVRWDSQQNMATNYAFSRKLSFNSTVDLQHRYFSNEVFDQDSSWQVVSSPSLFWNFTPKSRVALGYSIGQNRIRTKVGNTVTHEVRGGYFGRVTRKSSFSLDMAVSRQIPKSQETAKVKTFTTGLGYLYQLSGKTQVGLQLIRSVQNTTSEVVAIVDDVEQTQKTDQHFTNTAFSLTLNSRLSRKLTAVFNGSVTLFKSSVSASATADEDTEATQITFPLGITLNYILREWIRLNMSYTFGYRTGDEKTDRFRAHTWQTGMHVVF